MAVLPFRNQRMRYSFPLPRLSKYRMTPVHVTLLTPVSSPKLTEKREQNMASESSDAQCVSASAEGTVVSAVPALPRTRLTACEYSAQAAGGGPLPVRHGEHAGRGVEGLRAGVQGRGLAHRDRQVAFALALPAGLRCARHKQVRDICLAKCACFACKQRLMRCGVAVKARSRCGTGWPSSSLCASSRRTCGGRLDTTLVSWFCGPGVCMYVFWDAH